MSTFEQIPRVTALPTVNLKDSQVVSFVADATNGIEWLLQYTSSESTYKWRYIGGPPLYVAVVMSDSAESTAATHTTFQDLATAGPTITTPVAGDYDLEWGANMWAAAYGYMAPKFGAAAASTNDAFIAADSGGSSHAANSIMRRYAGLAASTAIKMQYRSGDNATSNWRRRWFKLTPIRVV